MIRIAFTALLVLSAAVFANAQTVEKKALTIDGAKKVIAGAVAYAKKNNAPGGVIAVVDDGGNLMALERLDGTIAAGANISIGKARTAALFKRPTKVFEDTIKNGRTALIALPDAFFTPLQGGIPITIDGQIVGGVGRERSGQRTTGRRDGNGRRKRCGRRYKDLRSHTDQIFAPGPCSSEVRQGRCDDRSRFRRRCEGRPRGMAL